MKERVVYKAIVHQAVRDMLKNNTLTEQAIQSILRQRGFDWQRLADIARLEKQKLYHWFYDTYSRKIQTCDQLTYQQREQVYIEVFKQLDQNDGAKTDYTRILPLLGDQYNRRALTACVSNARARWRTIKAARSKTIIDFSDCGFIVFE